MTSRQILPSETVIVGEWTAHQGSVKANDAALRIEKLINGYLHEVAVSDDGWSRLFRDPSDGRLWELTYPDGSAHGGGAPRLTQVEEEEVAKRYKI